MDVGGDADVQCVPISLCAQCSIAIADSSAVVVCQGKCKRAMHCSCLWNVTAAEVAAVSKDKNIFFVCDACLLLAESKVVPVLGCARMLSELLKKVNDLSNNFESKVKKVVNDVFLRNNKRSITAADDKGEPSLRTRLRSASKKRKVEENENSKKNDTPTSSISFSEVLKQKPAVVLAKSTNETTGNQKPDPVVVIKPKEGVNVGNIREQLRRKINPKQLEVDRVMEGRNGTVVVTLKDEASQNILKEAVEKNMGDQVDVKIRESMRPTIRIVGLSEEFDEDELKESLVDQNNAFGSLKHFKLRKFYCNKKWKYAPYSAIVELDAETFFKVMEVEKINCGWDRCRVYDGLDVTRCFKCCGFNHKVADCKADEITCPICSGNHPVKECDATVQKCANCEKMRKDRKLNIEVDHAAWSSQCPIYLRMKKRRNQQIDFTK